MTLRKDAEMIMEEAIRRVLPDEAVRQALENKSFGPGKLYVVAAGKDGGRHSGRGDRSGGMCHKIWPCQRGHRKSYLL